MSLPYPEAKSLSIDLLVFFCEIYAADLNYFKFTMRAYNPESDLLQAIELYQNKQKVKS
jgi:uncharacterized protein YegP (UPF0339 family)